MKQFHHRGSMGDIIYSLPTIISCGGGDLFLSKENQYDTLKELLDTQTYINSVNKMSWPRHIDYNLDAYREISNANPKMHLAKCHLNAFNKDYDLSKPWLRGIEPKKTKDIVVSITPRYHDVEEIDWKVLKPYIDRCVFIGAPGEQRKFRNRSGLLFDFHPCKNALEMAQVIRGSKLFIGNQSLGFALAEAMKHPRILNRYDRLDNCRPNSNNGHIFLSKDLIEYHISDLARPDIPTIIPLEDVENSLVLSTIFNNSEKPTIFLPYHGEFGAVIERLIKIVDFHKSKRKIVCVRKGDELYFPSANGFYYDWNDFVPDRYRRGFHWGRCPKNEKKKMQQLLHEEFEKIKNLFGTEEEVNYVHLWKFDNDHVYSKYSKHFRVDLDYKEEYDINVDVVISPRLRNSRPENNYNHWEDIVNSLNKEGFSVGAIGSESASQRLTGVVNSWDFENNSNAIIQMLKTCKLYIGLDTGVTHLASMLSIPMIVFSHANQKWYLTYYAKDLTTNYFIDMGKKITNYQKVVQEAMRFLK